jgi:hypothetical protein
MNQEPNQRPTFLQERQRASLTLRIGKRIKSRSEIDVSSAGLLSIGGLVSMILLSTAVIVHAAGGGRRAASLKRAELKKISSGPDEAS